MSLSLSEAVALRLEGIPRSPKELEQSLRLLGVLRKVGFQTSARNNMSLDGDGKPVPWWTHAANEWVKPRIRSTDRVFEYGSGASTLWLAQHAKSVVSVEHDVAWYEKVRATLPDNAQVVLQPSRGETSDDISAPYAACIRDYGPPFDIIVVDGMERNACARLASTMLSDSGIVIFDNSHRQSYRDGMNALAAAGFWRLDFSGCVRDLGLTSIFGRDAGRWLDASLTPEDVGT